jgi:tetratricopeptide (TPR) repeat protein/TolB-like protein
MSSLIPGFEYDIFISYRQKDNKGDRWVSEFVEALKTELESTFKEEINVYFDINPHDGLLDTHDVDASIKEKLKCLVFIPVLSRTYCDPKSFAWKNEFEAFVEQASRDQFGLKVRLPDGIIANRVLPVYIHDLDNDDIKLCESVLGGAPGGVEFIYKSAGINRPLRSKEEKPHDNLNDTAYRDQINKTALAIKEIILGLKREPDISGKEISERLEDKYKSGEDWKHLKKGGTAKLTISKFLIGAGILAGLIIAAILVYHGLVKQKSFDKLISKDGRIPVAVMPFQNMTNDTLLNIWQDGIQNILITSLSNSKELKVRQMETVTNVLQSKGLVDYASLTPSVASLISKKLETKVFIQGSIKESGSTIRLNAQIIDPKTKESIKSFQVDGSADSIFTIIDSLSNTVQDFLIVTVMKRGDPYKYWAKTNSPEALRYLDYADKAYVNDDYSTALEWLFKAMAIDSNFFEAADMITWMYLNQRRYDKAKQWCLRFYKKRDMMAMINRISINKTYARLFETPNDEIKYLRQLNEIDDLCGNLLIGLAYLSMHQWDKAIPELERNLEVDFKLFSKPYFPESYSHIVYAYFKTGQFKKARKLLGKSEKYYPDDRELTSQKAIISLAEGDTSAANRYIEKYKSILKDNSYSEPGIIGNIGAIYDESGFLDKAEEYYRQMFSMRPDNPNVLNGLAWFLIDKDRNINEGIELIDKALEKNPDDYAYLDTKGWGLYKQGKYKESLGLIERSWNLKPMYDHEVYLHLQEAKKAVAGLK